MTTPPSRPHPTDPAAGQRQLSPQTRQMIDELEGVYSHRDPAVDADVDREIERGRQEGISPRAVIGSAPPEPQPGRTAMSQKATDDSVRMLCFGGMTVMVCGGVSVLIAASDYGNPTVIGVFLGGLAGLALAISRLLKCLGQAAPREIHNHNSGPVYQKTTYDQSTHKTTGLRNTTNHNPKELP